MSISSPPLRFRFEWTAVLCALAPPTCPRALNQPPCFGADWPPPPLSFALRPRRNRPPWAGPFFLRRDKTSLPIASVYCHSEPPATGEPTKPLGCPSGLRVFAAAGDPVGSGLVASLAQPGGNVTG